MNGGIHMFGKLPSLLAAAATLLALGGCSSITDPARLEQFDWGEVEEGTTVTDGIDPAVGLGDLFVLGQVSTPTRCYRLHATFERDGSQLDMRVRATEANPDCGEGEGGYRYTATIRNLERGSYDLSVTHQVVGGNTMTFTRAVEL